MRNEYYIQELEDLVELYPEIDYPLWRIKETMESYEKDLEKLNKQLEFWQNEAFNLHEERCK